MVCLLLAQMGVVAQDVDWVGKFGGSGTEAGVDIALDHFDNVYSLGRFPQTVDCDPGVDTFNFSCTSYNGVFLSKLDADGNFLCV